MKELSNKNKSYEAPQITAVTFKVEQGFATSGLTSLFVHQQQEDFEDVTFSRDGYGSAAETGYFDTWE